MNKFIISLVMALTPSIYVNAQTTIDNNYFSTGYQTYTWDIPGSPYLIVEDIEIPDGSDLQIEPGVEVLFQGYFKMDVLGSINAIGTVDSRIIITSDVGNPWNGIRFDFSDNPHPAASKLYNCDISNAHKTGTTCTSPDPESSGGAIYVESFSNLEIYKCEIFNNSVQAQGGAIGLYSNSSPDIWECNIHNNSAEERGGGLCIMIDCDPEIKDNTFEKNESVSKGGGAIAIGDLGSGLSCSPAITGNLILNNSADQFGGGVFICNSDIINFSYNTFEGNIAQANGGGLCIQKESTVDMVGNVFLYNQSSSYGGGIFIGNFGSQPPDVTIDNSHFKENSAVSGGGIYANNSELDVTNSDFTENTASTDGGGIYASQSTSSIENCTFDGNEADGNGGGIYMYSPNSDPFYSNYSKINLNSFKSNAAYLGSALYYHRYDYTGVETRILNNLFVSNHATNKGVVYLQGNNNNTIFNHNTISDNTATSYISGVCVEKESYFPLITGIHKNSHNNILYNYLVDILMIETYTLPTNYATLVTLNYIHLDPHFDPSSYYHLSSSSLGCIDAGDNFAPMTSKDMDGNQRKWPVDTDYGCYEYGSQP
jgi:predicted outer membrane repeat protein